MYGTATTGGYGTTGRCHVARGITNNDNAGPTRTSVRGGATGAAASTTAAARSRSGIPGDPMNITADSAVTSTKGIPLIAMGSAAGRN